MDIKNFGRRLLDLPRHLSKTERWLVGGLLLIIIVFGSWKVRQYVIDRLITVPAYGGTFTEGLVGQPKLLSPLSATETNDKMILSLLYPGLTRTEAEGKTTPVLADSWEISDDGLTYTFKLKTNLFWHDGQPLTSSDAAETVRRVQDPATKSAYEPDWEGVTVEVVDPQTVKFHLTEAAAGFLSNTNLPIVPLHISDGDLQKSLIGSGPYKYASSTASSSQVKEIILDSNAQWFTGKPYIDKVIFHFFANQSDLTTAYQKNQIDSFIQSDTAPFSSPYQDLTTERLRMIFLNTQSDALKDVATRQKIINNESLPDTLTLKLLTHNNLADNKALRDQINTWQNNNLQINVTDLDSIGLLDAISKHDYDLLYVDIDMRADFDRFAIWHSSQISGSGLNFAQLNDAKTDKLLEQAHAMTDLDKRRDLTNQVNDRIKDLAVAKTLEQVHLQWYIGSQIKGIPTLKSIVEPADRFASISTWYIKTRHRTFKSIFGGGDLPNNT